MSLPCPKLGKSVVVFLSFLLITPITQFSDYLFSPAHAEEYLKAASPPNQSVLFAQTLVDTAGACYATFGRSFLLNWPSTLDSRGVGAGQVPISGVAIYIVTRSRRYGPLDLNHFHLELRRGLEPSLSDPSRVIFASLPPSGASLVAEYEEGLNSLQTALLTFTFHPLLSSEKLSSEKTK